MAAITLCLDRNAHKNSSTVAIAEPGPRGEIRLFGTISSHLDRLEKAFRRIAKAYPYARLEVADEGP